MNIRITNNHSLAKFIVAGICTSIAFHTTGMSAFADMSTATIGTMPAGMPVVSEGNAEKTTVGLSNTMETAAQGKAGQAEAVAGITPISAVAEGSFPVSSPAISQPSDNAGGRANVVIAGSSLAAGGLLSVKEANITPQPILGGATLTMLHSQTESQMVSCMIQTNDGSLIVVDGGLGADADYLTSQIASRGGHVAAWLVTHPHGDHVGALYNILQNEDARYASGQPAVITIDKIYYNFADLSWYQANDPEEYTMASAIIGSFLSRPASMFQVVNRGDTFQVDTAAIQVLNSRYEGNSDKGNNSGIVYKVTVNGVSILFLGDMSQEGGNHLLEEAGAAALKSDIVQMAHHGQNGVSQAFYQAVSPSVCLWPTPRWLWMSIEGKYAIQTTKSWMKDLGVSYHYVMMDGDQIIR